MTSKEFMRIIEDVAEKVHELAMDYKLPFAKRNRTAQEDLAIKMLEEKLGLDSNNDFDAVTIYAAREEVEELVCELAKEEELELQEIEETNRSVERWVLKGSF